MNNRGPPCYLGQQNVLRRMVTCNRIPQPQPQLPMAAVPVRNIVMQTPTLVQQRPVRVSPVPLQMYQQPMQPMQQMVQPRFPAPGVPRYAYATSSIPASVTPQVDTTQ